MFTEAQFTAAMEQAVKQKGGDYRFPRAHQRPDFYHGNGITPRYVTENGEAACLIGAAMRLLHMHIDPYTSASALGVLSQKVPQNVIYAARAAQIHQDMHNTWDESLAVYHAALRLDYAYAWSSPVTFYEAAVAVKNGAEPPEVIAPAQKFAEAIDSLSKAIGTVTFTFDNMPQETYSLMSGSLSTSLFPKVIVPTMNTTATAATLVASKKDHALVA